ncbi:MAG: hypothetical protein LC804_28015 [Acidobacteria bacterium]|nr:hypothetical protein [Acidobacteriota bacterium]
MKKSVTGAALLLFLAPVPAAPQSAAPPDRVERSFPAGGTVRLRLSAGGYEITGTPSDRILVRWRTDRPEQMSRVRASVDIEGAVATVRTHGPKNNFQVRVELPARSHLDVDLTAGELEIRDVVGDKNVEVWAGEVSIDVGQPDEYRHVDTAVRFGEIAARAFNVSKGGMFRSFDWTGGGAHQLRVRLFAGELTLGR